MSGSCHIPSSETQGNSVGLFELSVAILLDPGVGFSYLQAIEVAPVVWIVLHRSLGDPEDQPTAPQQGAVSCLIGRRGATKVFNLFFLRAFSPDLADCPWVSKDDPIVSQMLPYDRPDSLDVVGAIKAIGKIRKIIWKLAYKQTSFQFSRLPSTQVSGYRLQTRYQVLTSSLLLRRLCGEMEGRYTEGRKEQKKRGRRKMMRKVASTLLSDPGTRP